MHRQYRRQVRGRDHPHRAVRHRERHQGRHQSLDVRRHPHLRRHHRTRDVHPGHRDELLRQPDGDRRDDRMIPPRQEPRANRDAETWVEECCSDSGVYPCPERMRTGCYPVVDRQPGACPCLAKTRTGCCPVALPALRRSRHLLRPSKPAPKRQRVPSMQQAHQRARSIQPRVREHPLRQSPPERSVPERTFVRPLQPEQRPRALASGHLPRAPHAACAPPEAQSLTKHL
jgi:hypothetical protein